MNNKVPEFSTFLNNLPDPGRKPERERDLIRNIEVLESNARNLGLTLVAQSLNRAKNVAGWMLADNIEAAIKAMNGERNE